MSTERGPARSEAASTAFARLLERIDRGESIDFAAEIASAGGLSGELRELHAGWLVVEEVLSGLSGQDSALAMSAFTGRGRDAPLDSDTRVTLARLCAPDRGRERYERIELVARGGIGEVWRVRDRDLDRELAMKVLRAGLRIDARALAHGLDARGRDASLLRRFLGEARLLARLDHPGILPVFDVGVDGEGRVWFTLPLVRGRSLAEVLEQGSLHRSRVLETVLHAADAVAYAHAQGLVHRDLKPANVLVGRFGEVHVVDWGLATWCEEVDGGRPSTDTRADPGADIGADPGAGIAADIGLGPARSRPSDTCHGDVLGTPAYMPPEQAAGLCDQVGPRADVYALGAILYHALAGRPPYGDRHETSRDVVAAVLAGPPAHLSQAAADAPAELVAICEKAMARDPGDRYADVAAFADDVRAFLAGRVVRAYRTGAWPELVLWTQRNRALAVLATALLVFGATGLLAWSAQRDRAAREVLRLADVARLQDIERRAEDLGPPSVERRAAFEAWLADAEALAARRALHERSLTELALRAEPAAGGRLDLASDEDRWRQRVLVELVAGLERIADPDPSRGTIADVRERLRRAEEIERLSLVDAETSWRAVIAALADSKRSPAYAGLAIRPQLGLVPLGPDPASGLHEFAHLASGEPPVRDASGRLVLGPDSSIVLVLLPGGGFEMGSPPESEASWARPSEGPLREVELAPFFVAKHETSRAQWVRLAGEDPSWFQRDGAGGETALLPVESVDWASARSVLARVGLALPSEAQWERAARGGTTSRWWCGNEPGSLRGAVNGEADLDPRLRGGGARAVMPIDLLRANRFGLHHVLGNVAEWTLDPWSDEPTAGLAPGDGLRSGPDGGLRALRGGSYASGAAELRCAAREPAQGELRDRRVGLRAVRALDG